MELCQNVDNAVVLACRGEIRSPENSLLCVFGQANPAPTADNWIARFSFDTLPSIELIYGKNYNYPTDKRCCTGGLQSV
mgnify:FL=1